MGTILDQLQKNNQLSINAQAAATAAAVDSAATANTNATALAAALDKLGDASQVLKPSQPHFNPQGNLEDFLRFKDWRRQFDLFIKRVPEDNWADKSEWLKNSVKGKAFLLISSCSDDEAGYKSALVILDDKYKKTDYIREAMFDYIHNFKVPSPGKNHADLLDKLLTLKSYINELSANHAVDYKEQFIAHIVLKGLSLDVRTQFKKTCDELYPKITKIFDKAEEVANTLNDFANTA